MLKGKEIRTNELMTYQSDLINFVLDPSSTRGVILRAPLGMGKTKTLSVLASRIVSEKPAARVLILCPASLQQMWAATFNRKQRSWSVINRYKYREMLDDSAHSDIWVAGMVYIMSIDFAKKLDISKSILNVNWDLVIGDEFTPNVGAHAELFVNLQCIAKRFVSSIPPWVEIPKADLSHEITLIEWDQKNALPPVSVHLTEYILSKTEKRLEHAVQELCKKIDTSNYFQGLNDKAVLDRLRSSPVELENTLHNFLTLSEEKKSSLRPKEIGSQPSLNTEMVETTNSDNDRNDETLVIDALGLIEELQLDTKLQAVGALLDSLVKNKDSKTHIFVICAYSATLHYLAADFEGSNWGSTMIDGGMEYQECNEEIANFAAKGGVLIALPSALRGLEINATDIIFYDLSFNERELYVILSRFNTGIRNLPINIHAIVRPEEKDCQGVKVLRGYASGELFL